MVKTYRITSQAFDEANDIQLVIDVIDTSSSDTSVLEVEGAGEVFRLASIDNSEDAFTVFKGSQATIKFISTTDVKMSTFASGADDRWMVHAYIGSNTIFKGFLVMDDISEPFMPLPNVVTLAANDLGTIRDVPLIDFYDRNPKGMYRIIDLIAMALIPTGLELQINVAFNVKLNHLVSDISIPNTDDEHLFSTGYLDAKTFEDQVGTCINCSEVIKRILGESACLFQRQGMWWIVRVDEREQPLRGFYISTFESDGTFIENLGDKGFNKEIGKDGYNIFFSKESTDVSVSRPHRSVKTTYNYVKPLEVPDNIDFSRGTRNTSLDGVGYEGYDLLDWRLMKSNYPTSDLIPADTPIHLRRLVVNGYEKERYIVIEASSSPSNLIYSGPVPVNLSDKFELSISQKMDSNISGSGFQTIIGAQLRLYGDDGTYWTLDGPNSIDPTIEWASCTSTFTTNQKTIDFETDANEDQTQPLTLDIEIPPAPATGRVHLLLYQNNQWGDTNDTYILAPRLDHIIYRNGSYNRYTGQTQEVTQTGGFRAKRDETIYMSESSHKIDKGAIQYIDGFTTLFIGSVAFSSAGSFTISGNQLLKFFTGQLIVITGTTLNNGTKRVTGVSYSIIASATVVGIETSALEVAGSTEIDAPVFYLAQQYYDANKFPTGVAFLADKPYSEIQIYDVWNQFRNSMRIFQAVCQGLDGAALDSDSLQDYASLVHKWYLRDSTENTIDRQFQLLTFDQDWRLSEMTGTMREVYNSVADKSYVGREQKFIENG